MSRVLVTGATGTVGSQVVRELQERGIPVRAFVRDAGRAAAMLGSEVELALGDLAQPDSIRRALVGVERVFLACANVPDQVACEQAAIDAAKAAGVSRLVKLSAAGAALDAPLLYPRRQGRIERHLRDSGVPAAVVAPSSYMTMLLAAAETVRSTGKLFAPAGAAEVAFIDPRDVAAAAAEALGENTPPGRRYVLTGPEAITYHRIAEDLSAVTGRSIRYVEVPDEAAHRGRLDAGMPAELADFLVGLFRAFRAGLAAETTGDVRRLTGREPRTFRAFAEDHAARFAARSARAA